MAADPVVQHLIDWGKRQPSIRAVILTSSRCAPGGEVDVFSDYDVILGVTDVMPFYADRSWLEEFGTVLVLYRDPPG